MLALSKPSTRWSFADNSFNYYYETFSSSKVFLNRFDKPALSRTEQQAPNGITQDIITLDVPKTAAGEDIFSNSLVIYRKQKETTYINSCGSS